ncbi:hypothetical protein QWJ26_15440 [Streptomyces sp. CSDS2]|uniref:hypothetical protein n=1 Tax=Streptomyces sp. CSDS2 TaxID=3055051 RepID=UPI0025AFC895|nr:hypothetical protein [Streptomyces sp. CSDS2]MDN3261184.1 hypothetical protein [Streptomyces sp. CSDS2]
MPATDPIAPQTSTVFAPCATCCPRTAVTGEGTLSLDAHARRHARSLSRPLRYELKNVTFTLPSPRSVPLAVWQRLHDGTDPLTAFQALVGEAKTREMTAAGFTLGDLEVIVEEWEHRGGVRRHAPASPAPAD